MDDVTQRLVERTRARQEAMQQKRQHSGLAPQRKRKPLASQNSEENSTSPASDIDKPVDEVSESPNKRTRTDCPEDVENAQKSTSQSDANVAPSKTKQSSHVNLRMQKLLNQRKIWEAEEKGESISFDCDNLPSPISHANLVPSPAPRQTKPSEQDGRKRRLAALAARVKGWEDDTAHVNPLKTPEDEKSPVHWKPPTGKVIQAGGVPVQKVVPQRATAPTNLKKAGEDGDGLSVDNLVKFALAGKGAERRSPVKAAPRKSVIALGNNAKTVLQTRQQTITVNSSHSPTGNVAAQSSRTLQQRMLELQSNGITEADLGAMNTSSANLIMEKARAERQKELAELRNRKVHGVPIHGKDKIEQGEEKDEKLASEDETPENNDTPLEDKEEMNVDEHDDKVDVGEGNKNDDGSRVEEEVYTSACDKSQEDDFDKEEDEEDQQELSYGDSLLEESTGNDASVSEDAKKKNSDDEEEETSDDQMIDDLFDGVLSEDEDDMLTTPPRSQSPLAMPSLTRQKSKLEIKSELTVRKQTCNEAEDTHTLTQPSKFQRTCLSKSNSTESIVSLCQENDFPVYTISAYRTDKRRQSTRVDKRVVRNEAGAAKATLLKRKVQDRRPVQEVISGMMDEVSRQQRVIQQASAALNCCYDAHHGKGTITEVEAEKLLLIASEKRLALLAEIQHLKQRRAPKEDSPFKPCPGVVTVAGIRLPLRTEYIFSIANKREAGDIRNHYYFVLVRNKQQMFATQLVSTLDDISGDSLVFKGQFKIDNLASDFKITLEVYSLNQRTRADGIPVQDKSKGKLSGILHKSLTPKKLRTSKRTSHLPAMMSPGGPNAIRISNFALIGSATITLDDITGHKFALQRVPFLSPISGQILCKFTSDFRSAVEQRGFLTMFDDVGGLGAWHRRWCALIQGRLYSWTYPDDEQHKKPLMTLALRECISREITTVERILCARPNTFELRTMRARRQGDKQNLISEGTGSVMTTKHWLSADTKEERVAWIECLNQALVDVKAWDSEALKPFK